MKYSKNCLIKKGYFPETAKDVEEEFIFVSIDAGLSEPTYNELCYFYPRLKQGGYIFVHDGNDPSYPKVKASVNKFSKEFNVPPFLLTDNGDGVIIIK